jgi:hypothetical protein
MKKFLAALSAALMVGVLSFAQPALAAEPTVHEIYQAADAGRMNDANRMIKEVLEAHPESGKAHYVNAELLAKQNRTHEAAAELAKAEKLAPGLPFANAQAVTSLRSLIENRPARSSSSANSARADQASYTQSAASSSGGFPWGVVIAGVGVVLFIAWAVRFMTRRSAPANMKDGYNGGPGGSGYNYRPVYPQGGPAAPYGAAPYGAAPAYGPAPQAPGLGSQVLGGLATGAAVGVGVAAGEQLFRHVFDGNHDNGASNNQHLSNNDAGYTPFQSIPDQNVSDNQRYDDMGGNDFGINDTSSWDDGGGASGGNDDWT